MAGQLARVATVASRLLSRRLLPAVPPPFPALPAPPSLLSPSVPPSCRQYPISASFSTARLCHLKGQKRAGSPDRRPRRSGTVSPAAASAWLRRERLDPVTGAGSGEWGHGATSSPGPCAPGPPLPSGPGARECWGGTRAGWRGAALRPPCQPGSANKATFPDQFRGGWSIGRIRLSWRWGRKRKLGDGQVWAREWGHR